MVIAIMLMVIAILLKVIAIPLIVIAISCEAGLGSSVIVADGAMNLAMTLCSVFAMVDLKSVQISALRVSSTPSKSSLVTAVSRETMSSSTLLSMLPSAWPHLPDMCIL